MATNQTASARHHSAMKEHRQSEKKRLRNRIHRGRLRAVIKAQRLRLQAKDQGAADAAQPSTVAAIDQAVAKGILHKNAAARRKSRLQRQLNALSASGG